MGDRAPQRPHYAPGVPASIEEPSSTLDGLLAEARALYPLRHLNALNTVGYKELFQHFDGALSLDEAVARIKRNTRVYARKQQTWFRRDASITWFHPDDVAAILRFLEGAVGD